MIKVGKLTDGFTTRRSHQDQLVLGRKRWRCVNAIIITITTPWRNRARINEGRTMGFRLNWTWDDCSSAWGTKTPISNCETNSSQTNRRLSFDLPIDPSWIIGYLEERTRLLCYRTRENIYVDPLSRSDYRENTSENNKHVCEWPLRDFPREWNSKFIQRHFSTGADISKKISAKITGGSLPLPTCADSSKFLMILAKKCVFFPAVS